MASISTDTNGRRRILFTMTDGARKQIRLGKASKKDAKTIRDRIEEIIKANGLNMAIDADTVRWLTDISDKLHKKLSAVGLAEARQKAPKPNSEAVGPFIDRYIKMRQDVKPNTFRTWRQARDLIVEYFGSDRDVARITALDAKAFNAWLAAEGFACASVSKYTYFARQFFQAAVDARIISESPFRNIKAGRRSNRARQQFIDRATITRVLDCCTDPEFKLVIALSRFGGLRVPSELAGLKWQHIDRERGRMLITSPKTERYEGGASREIPLFPELVPFIDEWFERCPDRVEYVIPSNRFTQAAWRTRLLKLLRRVGIEPWPKIYHNMRATRQTELEKVYPTYKVCRWLGNSERVANEHYLMVTDDDFRDAATRITDGTSEKAAQKAAQIGAEMEGNARKPEIRIAKNPEKYAISRGSDGGGGNRTRARNRCK
jgi:integrase